MGRPPRWLVATLALGLPALGAAGAWFYFAQRQYLQHIATANLLAIAQAKVDEIVAWRAERLGDAAVLQEDPFFARAVARWLAGHQAEYAADILTRLRSTKDHYGFDDVRLVDRAGRVVLAASGRRGVLNADEAAALRAAFRDRRPTMGDVYLSPGDSIPHLAVVAPLFASNARATEPLGAVVHVVDARHSIFRLVASWPSPSPSAEAVLVRRDGDSVLFLSARRFQPALALHPRISLSRRAAPAVLAVLGAEGVVRAVDYRGVNVLAALRAVPGTPWFLVAKVDEAEALAVWRTRVALVFALLLGLVLAAAATAIAIAQRSTKAHYRRLYEAEAALAASDERFRLLFAGMTEGFAYCQMLFENGEPVDFIYLDVNAAFEEQTGLRNVAGRRVSEVIPGIREADPELFALFARVATTGTPEHVEIFVSALGDWFDVSAYRPAPEHFVAVFEVITDRKRAEDMVRESQREAADALDFNHSILGTSSIGILAYRQSGQCVFANEAAAKIVGTDVAGLLAQDFHRIQSWKESGAYDAALKALATDTEQQRESHLVTTFGRDVWLNFRFSTFHSGGEQHLLVFAYDVTERGRAEEALRREQTMLARTEGIAHVGSWEWDVAPDTVTWSDELFRIFQRDPREGAPSFAEHPAFYHPDDMARLRQAVEVAVAEGTPYELELRANRKDGETRLCVARGVAEMSPGGRAVRLYGSLQDITERKGAEEALARASGELDAILDATAEGILVVDEAGRVLLANARFREMWRIPDAVASSRDDGALLDFVLDQLVDPEGFLARVQSLYRQDVEDWDTVAFKDGRVFERFSRPLIEDGHPAARLWSFRDITERRRTDEALRESEERYRSIIEQLNDVYYRTDRDGCITMMSPSAAPLFGFPSTNEMIGRPIESLWQEPSQRTALLAAIGERGFVYDYETTAVRTDGTPFAVAVSSHYVRNASGAIDGVEGIIRNITERKQAEASLRALARHLDSVREEEHIRIARQIHDELGQALTALRLDLTWVGRKLPKGNTALRRRIDAAVALTDETITVGQRIVSELRPSILDDLGLVPALEWYAEHFAQRSGLRIAFDPWIEESVVPAHLAATAYRIVQEALTNVARHARATHAWVRVGEQEGALTIEVRDDGQGLPEGAADSPLSLGFVGMRERVASQGGALSITSQPGAGTTVRATFPPVRQEAPRTDR